MANPGRGRGRFYPPRRGVEMLQQFQIGKPPVKTYIKPDPVTGNYKLHVKCIPKHLDYRQLFNLFKEVGTPLNLYMPPVAPQVPFKWAFVEFETFQEARRAIAELNNNVLAKDIAVDFAREKNHPDNFIDAQENCLTWVTNNSSDSPLPFENKMIPKTMQDTKITIKNERVFSVGCNIDDLYTYQIDLAPKEYLSNIEDGLVNTALHMYKNMKDGHQTCVRCEAQCAQKCSNCGVNYCSEDCIEKDWPQHSLQCKYQPEGQGSNCDLRASGDNRLTNGFKNNNENETPTRDFNRRSNFNDADGPRRESGFGGNRNNFNDRKESGGFDGNHRQGFDDNRRGRGGDGDRSFNSDRKRDQSQNRDGGFNRQNNSGGARNMFEERRSKMNANRSNDDRPNFRSSNFNQTTNADFNKKPCSNEDEDWGALKQENKTQSSIQQVLLDNKPQQSVTEEKQIKTEDKENKTQSSNQQVLLDNKPQQSVTEEKQIKTEDKTTAPSGVTEKITLTPGQSEEVEISDVASPGVFSVTLNRHKDQQNALLGAMNAIDGQSDKYQPFTPALGAICAVNFDGVWCRARITCMDPLTVHYIDFGNSEILTADRLFTILAAVPSFPPQAIQIKLIEGTPDEYINQEAYTTFIIIPVKETGDHWVVKVAGVTYPEPSVEAPKAAPVTQPTVETSAPVTSSKPSDASQLASQPTPLVTSTVAATPESQYPLFLPADKFSQVFVTFPEGENAVDTYFVGPPNIFLTLGETFTEFAKNPKCKESVHNPQVGTIALANYMDGLYRVKVVNLSPFKVFYIDYGNIEDDKPENLMECPETHKYTRPLVQKVKLAPGTNSKYFNLPVESGLSVKPVSVLSDGTIVVQVEGESYSEASVPVPAKNEPVDSSKTTHPAVPTNPVRENVENTSSAVPTATPTKPAMEATKPRYPDFLAPDKFTQVTVTVPAEGELDAFYIADSDTHAEKLLEMNFEFRKNPKCAAQVSNPQIGTIAVSEYMGGLYRVKVVNLSPLKIYYMDYGNIETTLPEDLKVCCETYIDTVPLIHKAKVAPGTNYTPAPDDVIHVKPVSVLSDGTVVVEVKGASNTAPTQPAEETCSSSEVAKSGQENKKILESIVTSNIVEHIHKGWQVEIITLTPSSVFEGENTCMLCCHQLPETKNFLENLDLVEKFNEIPSSHNFSVKEGALVFCKEVAKSSVDEVASRGKVLSGGAIAFSDKGEIVCASQCNGGIKEVPREFATIPLMAVTLITQDFSTLPEVELGFFDVVDKIDRNGALFVKGKLQVGEKTMEGEVQAWEPMMSPFPLYSGERVQFLDVIQADNAVINSTQHIDVTEAVQHCCKNSSCKELQVKPKIGDYVAYFVEEEQCFYRARIENHDEAKNQYTLYKLDYGCYGTASADKLQPLPKPLKDIPQQARKVTLVGLDDTYINDAYRNFLKRIVADDKNLTIHFETIDSVTLKDSDTGMNINDELNGLLQKGFEGKFTLSELRPPAVLPGERTWAVACSEPLHLQDSELSGKYFQETHDDIQIFCTAESPYTPIPGELCLVKYSCEGIPPEFYRAVCKENLSEGVYFMKLVDFGNEFEAQVSDIRRIDEQFLILQCLALRTKIKGLPEKLSGEMKTKLSSLLPVYAGVTGSFEPDKEGKHYVFNSKSLLDKLGLQSANTRS